MPPFLPLAAKVDLLGQKSMTEKLNLFPVLFCYGCLRFYLFIYLFIYKDREREGERGRETSMCGCLSHASYWGPGLQHRHTP